MFLEVVCGILNLALSGLSCTTFIESRPPLGKVSILLIILNESEINMRCRQINVKADAL